MENHLLGRNRSASTDSLKAGTGFMSPLTDWVRKYTEQGYTRNLVPCFDHFECQSGLFKIYPQDFVVDHIERIDNTSDPDDQAILYALSVPDMNLKGLYIDSYGAYHDDLSRGMIRRLTSG